MFSLKSREYHRGGAKHTECSDPKGMSTLKYVFSCNTKLKATHTLDVQGHSDQVNHFFCYICMRNELSHNDKIAIEKLPQSFPHRSLYHEITLT